MQRLEDSLKDKDTGIAQEKDSNTKLNKIIDDLRSKLADAE